MPLLLTPWAGYIYPGSGGSMPVPGDLTHFLGMFVRLARSDISNCVLHSVDLQ